MGSSLLLFIKVMYYYMKLISHFKDCQKENTLNLLSLANEFSLYQ